MAKPVIDPLLLYKYEPLSDTVIDDVFDYVMTLLAQDDPGILDSIDV
jgi:hypothetical protein